MWEVDGLSRASSANPLLVNVENLAFSGTSWGPLQMLHFSVRAAESQRSNNAALASYELLIVDELGYVPLSNTGAELLFETFSQRYERASTLVTSNLPFDEWTEVFGSERLTGALLDRLTHHVHILEMNGDSYRLKQSRRKRNPPADR
jgi:DNA replication protein DnaC